MRYTCLNVHFFENVQIKFLYYCLLKVVFQVFNQKNSSQVGIDDIMFKEETEGTTQSFTSAYKYRSEGM